MLLATNFDKSFDTVSDCARESQGQHIDGSQAIQRWEIERWENEGGVALAPPENTTNHNTVLCRFSDILTIMNETEDDSSPATAIMTRDARAIQAYGHLIPMPLALCESARQQSVDNLNQLLADTMTLRDMYKKHHWQVLGPMFYQLHLLFDKHYASQAELVDTIAERIMVLGGVSIAMAQDVADNTTIPQPPKDRECPESQLTRLLQAHEITLQAARSMARQAIEMGDDGTDDMLVSDVIRGNELQVWFVSQHLVGAHAHIE
ncbi:Dps family protein [Rhodopirellula baltica]|uniref:Ferritin Dps family protein n=1 Tax=Rhodopirellula baltica WH47 TaxID=991778 RepID=F2B140_RHOBT|nr:DNA starvation/stationary phase protection protein [Rhodopirellula baltica]EGF24392.1 ferritin Dps family protein [Rhodopirellula baltica WH47]